MNDAAIIGAAWNDHLQSQLDATLTVTAPPVEGDETYDVTSGQRTGKSTIAVAVKCMPPALARAWDGTTLREKMQTLIGQMPDGTPDPQPGDILTIGARTWSVIKIEPLTDMEVVYCWLLDLEAVAL